MNLVVQAESKKEIIKKEGGVNYMKKLACKSMGTNCDFVAMGKTEEEVMGKMMEHMKMEHPDKMMEKEKMMMDMKGKIQDAM